MDIDRRTLDFLVGLDTEFSDMVDGSHLYFPSAVHLEDVVLPQDQKNLIVETVENFSAYKKVRKTLGLDKTGRLVLQPVVTACVCDWYAVVAWCCCSVMHSKQVPRAWGC